MKVLYLTQGYSLNMFAEIDQGIRKTIPGKSAYYVADSECFEGFSKTNDKIVRDGRFVKEWEILREAASHKPDLARLKRIEEEYGDPTLWHALLADRRIILGKRAVFHQDYAPRYSSDRMLSILDVASTQIRQLFESFKPDAVIGYACVTIGYYLSFREAASRGIPFINLRNARFKDYFHGGDSVYEPSGTLRREFERIQKDGLSESEHDEASGILEELSSSRIMYSGHKIVEGVHSNEKVISPQLGSRLWKKGKRVVPALAHACRRTARQCWGEYKHDTNPRSPFYEMYHEKIRKPLYSRLIARALDKKYVSSQLLKSETFAFFPLHKEPELSMLVNGRSFLNQIELVRFLAISLPIGMKLIVKEHPGSIGYRSLAYYKKLLEIPNVWLVSPYVNVRDILPHCSLTAIISGTVGLEALLYQKPVLVFGQAPFTLLQDSMVKCVDDYTNLPTIVSELLSGHRHDAEALLKYYAAVVNTSVDVDFYSTLLGKKGGKFADNTGVTRDEHFANMVNYLLSQIALQHKHLEKVAQNGS